MTRVTLTNGRPGSRVIAGVQFTDGVSDDVPLSSHKRAYFEMRGASFEEPRTPSTSWSKDDLVAHAQSVGADVTDAATKADLLDAIRQAESNR